MTSTLATALRCSATNSGGLNPAVGTILMSFSTVVVALNAQLLVGLRYEGECHSHSQITQNGANRGDTLRSALDELAEWTTAADKVIVF